MTQQDVTQKAGKQESGTDATERPRNSAPKHSARPSSTPIGRSAGFERTLVTLLGLLLLTAGLAALVVGAGWLGGFRAQRPVLDPLVGQWTRSYPQWAAPLAIVLGIVLFAIGLWWLARSLRREPKPDMRVDAGSKGTTTITSPAITGAVRSDAESVTGVTRAKVRMAGSQRRPSLRLTLSLQEGTNVRHVWEELDDKVLARARQALETDVMPTAVRLELDRAPRQRVR